MTIRSYDKSEFMEPDKFVDKIIVQIQHLTTEFFTLKRENHVRSQDHNLDSSTSQPGELVTQARRETQTKLFFEQQT